jgi:hypothetical protein
MQKKCQKNDSQSGKCKKNAQKMTPSLGNAKKYKNNAKKMQNKMRKTGKKMKKMPKK